MPPSTESKQGSEINVGDTVDTRFRGGHREGKVEAVLKTQADIDTAGDLGVGVKHAPKVVFTDQHGHRVAHNPGTLTIVEDE